MTPIRCLVAGEYFRTPGLRELARQLKDGHPDALTRSARLLAPLVSPGTVLVPVPSHTGRAGYTLQLARQLARLTGATVSDCLRSDSRQSSFHLKKSGVTLLAADMGFRLSGDAPTGRVLLVDNVVASGNTMAAALQLLPSARVLALAVDSTARDRVDGITVERCLDSNIEHLKSTHMQNIYYIEAARHTIDEYLIDGKSFLSDIHDSGLPAYDRMMRWLEATCRNLPADSYPVEFVPDREMNIISHRSEKTPLQYRQLDKKDIVSNLGGEAFARVPPAEAFTAKGYDIGQGGYVFGVVTTSRVVKPVRAESLQQALDSLRTPAAAAELDRQLSAVKVEQHILSRDIRHCVTLPDGTTVDMVEDHDFIRHLKDLYPQGITVRVDTPDYDRLRAWQDYALDYSDDPGEERLFTGVAFLAQQDAQAEGDIALVTELHLQPDDYVFLYPAVHVFHDGNLSSLGFSDDRVAVSLLMARCKDLSSFRAELPVNRVLLDRLTVGGVPYLKVMDLAERNGVRDTASLCAVIGRENLNKAPQWLQQLAYERTQPQRHRFWQQQVLPHTSAFHKAYEQAFHDAAAKYGFGTADRLKEVMNDPHTDIGTSDKLMLAVLDIQAAYKPFKAQADKAGRAFDLFRVEAETRFVRDFMDFARDRITDIAFRPAPDGTLSVRCRIDGQQQMAAPVTVGADRYREDGMAHTIAAHSFRSEIADAITAGADRSQTLRR